MYDYTSYLIWINTNDRHFLYELYGCFVSLDNIFIPDRSRVVPKIIKK